jgi:hypothetical protein
MTEYNGWTNYATWRVNLEIFDGLDPEWYFRRKPEHSALIDWARQWAEDLVEMSAKEGLALDYARAFMSDVNYGEITQHWLEDYWHDDDINNDEQAAWYDTSAE